MMSTCSSSAPQRTAFSTSSYRWSRSAARMDGAMRIALPDGTEQMVSSGEISVRGLYGYV